MNHANKPRNGPVSPRGDMNNPSYSNHQPHYNSYNNSSQNHSGSVSSSSSPNNNQTQHPNSDLINFVSGAWKEKVRIATFYFIVERKPLDEFQSSQFL